jgi:hypothetical protein
MGRRQRRNAPTEDLAMAQYSPKSFLRLVPNTLLQEFFNRRSLFRDFLWYLQREKEIDLIFERVQGLPQREREEIEKTFRDVDEMATEDGIRAIIEEGRFHSLDLAAELEPMAGHHHKAMWTFLRHDKVFYVASLINYVDSLSGRFWQRRADLPHKTPRVTPDAMREFALALSKYYQETEGRGHRCTVEPYLRANRYHYFFAYPDNYTETYIGHSEEGQLVKRPQKSAFEVIFIYDAEDGTLDLFAKGGRRVQADLQQYFGRFILEEHLGPSQPFVRTFELDGLLSRSCDLSTDPEDGIAEVRIRKMRLSPVGNSSRRITLEADPRGAVDEIYDVLERCVSRELVHQQGCHVSQVTIEFRFIPTNGTTRKKPMKFDVSFPDSSTLKNLRDDQQALGEKYLKRWGITRA